MKNIKLFENFDAKYLWPEAKFWIDKLEPEELCFLGVYSYMLEKDKKQPLFETEYDGTNETDPDDLNGDGSLEMSFTFPVAKAEYSPSLTCEIIFNGDYLPYDPGDYMNAPEGGEYVLNNIDIESAYYLDKDEVNDYELTNMEYKSEFVTKSDMINLLKYIASYFIRHDEDSTDSKPPVIPQGLKDKCENLRKEMPNVTKGYGMISRFTGK